MPYPASAGNANMPQKKRPGFLLFIFIAVTIIVSSAIIYGFSAKKPMIHDHPISGEVVSKPEVDNDPINGISTGDSYVLVVFSFSSAPETGKLYRDNMRLEKLGFVMDPNSLRISQGYGANSITAVYHKKK